MKASLPISIFALLLSVVALAIAMSSRTGVSEEEIERQVDIALARKEKAYVQSLAPKMDQVYRDMLGSRYAPPEEEPKTFPELLKPAIQIISGMTAQ